MLRDGDCVFVGALRRSDWGRGCARACVWACRAVLPSRGAAMRGARAVSTYTQRDPGGGGRVDSDGELGALGGGQTQVV